MRAFQNFSNFLSQSLDRYKQKKIGLDLRMTITLMKTFISNGYNCVFSLNSKRVEIDYQAKYHFL